LDGERSETTKKPKENIFGCDRMVKGRTNKETKRKYFRIRSEGICLKIQIFGIVFSKSYPIRMAKAITVTGFAGIIQ
jgi:hypothetical protein